MFFLIFAAIGLALAFAPPRFRKLGWALVGAVLLIFLAIVLFNRKPVPPIPSAASVAQSDASAESRRFDFDKYQRDKRDNEDPDAKTRIPLTAVRFGQVHSVAGAQDGTIQAIQARLYNDSPQFTLTDYSYYLVIKDCLDQACTPVYDQHDSGSLAVPPGQARDLVISVPKSSANSAAPFILLGTARVELTPTATRAYRTGSPAN